MALSLGGDVSAVTATIHVTSTDRKAHLPADHTFTGAAAGKHTFNTAFDKTGRQAVGARDMATATITGVQSVVVVR